MSLLAARSSSFSLERAMMVSSMICKEWSLLAMSSRIKFSSAYLPCKADRLAAYSFSLAFFSAMFF